MDQKLLDQIICNLDLEHLQSLVRIYAFKGNGIPVSAVIKALADQEEF